MKKMTGLAIVALAAATLMTSVAASANDNGSCIDPNGIPRCMPK